MEQADVAFLHQILCEDGFLAATHWKSASHVADVLVLQLIFLDFSWLVGLIGGVSIFLEETFAAILRIGTVVDSSMNGVVSIRNDKSSLGIDLCYAGCCCHCQAQKK